MGTRLRSYSRGMAKPKTKPTAAEQKAPVAPAVSPSFPSLSEEAYDLAALEAVIGKPDEKIRRLLLRSFTEQTFYEWGVQTDTGNILADVPRFVSSALRILVALDAPRRALVKLQAPIFALIVGETRALESMSRDHQAVASSEGGARADREVVLKRLSGKGVALRNSALAGLRSAVGERRLELVRKAGSDASSADALVTGMNAVAAFIDEVVNKGDDDDRAALDFFVVGASCAEELRTKAAEIAEAAKVTAATGKRVSQRSLDIQDGRVLVLMDMVDRAFRQARRTDKSILLPELNRLSSFFASSSSTPVAKEGTAPVAGKVAKGDSAPA